MEKRILLMSFGKSGTLLLVRIIYMIQKQNASYNSYKQSIGLDKIINKLCQPFVHQPYISFIDHIEYIENELRLVFPHPDIQNINMDLNLLNKNSTLITSHTNPVILKKVVPFFSERKRIYIYRDIRDAIISWAHYTTTEKLRKRNTQYRYNCVEDLLNDNDLIVKKINSWGKHIKYVSAEEEGALKIKFEDLINYKADTIDKISNFLDLKCNIDEIVHETSMENSKKISPEHIRKGSSRQWMYSYTEEQLNIFRQLVSNELVELGYEKNTKW